MNNVKFIKGIYLTNKTWAWGHFERLRTSWSVVWHHLLLLMNGFNKTEAAVSCAGYAS